MHANWLPEVGLRINNLKRYLAEFRPQITEAFWKHLGQLLRLARIKHIPYDVEHRARTILGIACPDLGVLRLRRAEGNRSDAVPLSAKHSSAIAHNKDPVATSVIAHRNEPRFQTRCDHEAHAKWCEANDTQGADHQYPTASLDF